ncbi:pseudouridine synthase [Propionicimonas sp.]|uniref:pseudouridine synthase n=1 Tax=Propionicimonas sp. TaxID=1955623 RepID=UPI0017C3B842|nr:pseudouridine synthase [Propionicimonas sp.]MBU3977177.1 rRNA pseudouridine synthase [Actinomycetota bacterium]MBA3021103.1 rRNA pseudouridine synthase [Propionicimonas sp.]MBU3985687.1 rRNA pseudouridine synthase [Actinomycetota bacterium]MBU4008472.1 rRNA pseudouridine synthase [Actinomycetota bacterium]MBU4066378.1 rRNA pseudouridine synthase [Actinomycetota bacterium]
MSEEEGIRLQKALAQAGVASRRVGENLIHAGRVEVNGKVVEGQGMRVDPTRDVIRVDGVRIPPQRNTQYLVLNKPRGVISAMEDPHGRPTLAQYVPEGVRLFHVGRLDSDTEGLLLLTNDGDFAQRMTHPSYEVSKTYLAEVDGAITEATLKRLRGGIELEDGPIKPDDVKLVQRADERSMVQVTLHSGRNRIVRRMFDAIDHPVRRLSRLSIGPVKLGDLRSGATRELTREELGALLDLTGL